MLDMPAGRSLIHNPPAIKRTIAISDIAAVQARDEAYRGLLSAQMHRAYRLLLKDGSDIFLFEERALGTNIATASLNPTATDLAAHLGVPFTDLGMAQGINGLFGVVLARAPEWGEPALSPEVRRRLWTRVQLTGLFALAAMAIAVLLMILL